MPPLYLDTSALDFRAITDTYIKIADPTVAVRPEFATERQALTTSFARADGQQYVETENIAEVGMPSSPGRRVSAIALRRWILLPCTSRCVVRMVRWCLARICPRIRSKPCPTPLAARSSSMRRGAASSMAKQIAGWWKARSMAVATSSRQPPLLRHIG